MNSGDNSIGHDVSIATGAASAAGVHSLASQATVRVMNNNAVDAGCSSDDEDNASAIELLSSLVVGR